MAADEMTQTTRRMMQAAVFTGPRQMSLVRVEVPQPGPGQVLIRMEGCGVCGSNVPNWEGMPWTRYPSEPGLMGHEGWGRVEAIGPAVLGLKRGDRVAALSSHAYAEYDLAEAAHIVRLPDHLESDDFPGESLGCAMNVFRRADIREGQTIAIVGIGFLGALLTRLARTAGARVIAISRRPYALETARRMGADLALPMDDRRKVVEQVREANAGALCDRVIEAVGRQEALDLATELTRERGKLIIAGYHQEETRQVNLRLWNWRGLDVINAHERDPKACTDGIRAAIDAVSCGRISPGELYTHRYPLERIDEALNAVADRPDGFLKALVVFG